MPDWTRGDFVEQLKAHGTKYLTLTQAQEMIQQAVEDVDLMWDWPYRLVELEGQTLPLTRDDFGQVLEVAVEAENYGLEPEGRAALVRRYGDLDVSGAALRYYFEAEDPGLGSGKVLRTYPVDTRSFRISYLTSGHWRKVADSTIVKEASDDADAPLCPPDWRSQILLRARIIAKEENDEHDEAYRLLKRFEERYADMAADLDVDQLQAPKRIRVTREPY